MKLHPIRDLFARDEGRFQHFSWLHDGLFLDLSKTQLERDTFALLLEIAAAAGLQQQRELLFSGGVVNQSENRAALHSALRLQPDQRLLTPDLAAAVLAARERMLTLADQLHQGRDARGQPVTDVIHVGIGGSALGPELVYRALGRSGDGSPRIHFLAGADAHPLMDLLARLDAETTVVIVASKSFTTAETLINAKTVRSWLRDSLVSGSEQHLYGVTAKPEMAVKWGIPQDQVLPVWDWVGGRFSLWSAMGFPAAIGLGSEQFQALLAGAAAMDEHFRTTPLQQNLPVLSALSAIWHRNVCGYPVLAVMPYDQRLLHLPAWLQQLSMESNGKSVDTAGEAVSYATGGVIIGGTGTVAQHSLFQAFHQGTDPVPLEFIGVIKPDHEHADHHQLQLSHLLAQSEALALGRDSDQTRSLLRKEGLDNAATSRLAPFRVFPGNRPSVTLLLDRLTPYRLGQLLALYEHRTFVESVVWNINAFDQWGVEYGKQLAEAASAALKGQGQLDLNQGLVRHIRKVQDG